MKKSYLHIMGFLTLCLSFVAIWLYVLFTPVVTELGGKVYYLRPGLSKKSVIMQLTQQGIISHPGFLSLYAFFQASHLKTGEYLFPKGSTPLSIWRQISSGTGFYYHPFTIIPGWTFKQLCKALANAQGLRHLTTTLTDQQIMERLGYSKISPEGEFFPETYNYTLGVPDLVILKRALDLMQNKLKIAWQNRNPNLPYPSAYEALIAASLVEKEAYLNSERPIIASILINRLAKNMLLQFDPTVIYGLGDRYDGKIHKANLKEDTPYNTYVHKGLPPTPIAMPSLDSLNAVMHPQETDYYYFVAKGDGSHQFSKNLTEHNAAVKASVQRSTGAFNEGIVRLHMQNLLEKKIKHISLNVENGATHGARQVH